MIRLDDSGCRVTDRTHSVASHAVWPTRAVTVGPDSPNPDPVTVTEKLPPTPCGRFVVATSCRRGVSNETACVRLAVASWLDTVAESVRVRATPAASLHLVEGVRFRGVVFGGGSQECG